MAGKMTRMAIVVLGVFSIYAAVPSTVNAGSAADLSANYYQTSCPNIFGIVYNVTFKYLKLPGPNHSLSLGPALLRMHFHDCFVRGCDASVLLKNGSQAERDGKPNADSLRGFEVIDAIKAKLEAECPGIVSCADTLALAAMYSVKLLGGPSWIVPLGRRDGNESHADEANNNLPAPTLSYTGLVNAFSAKNLSAAQMVVLSGAHTIGSGNCFFVAPRLYNFSGVGDSDPSLNATYVAYLKNFCPRNVTARNATAVRLTMKPCVPLNSAINNATYTDGQHTVGCNSTFDSSYYDNLNLHQGYFGSDSALITNPFGQAVVNREADSSTSSSNYMSPFFSDFAYAMIALSQISPLTNNEGSIHVNCSNPSG